MSIVWSDSSLVDRPSRGMPVERWGGISLKPEHYREIIENRPAVAFFEVHAENYMSAGGPPHRYLTAIREHYAISVHGVGLSLGGHLPLDRAHLDRLKTLVDRYEPAMFSEHLAWSTHPRGFLNDLLPLPYTHDTLRRMCEHIDAVQSHLGRNILLENPATYIRFDESTFEETDFINEIVGRTGCGILLDINNIVVSCANHERDPFDYVSRINAGAVGEFHLAGHQRENEGTLEEVLIDTHDRRVGSSVWALYEAALSLVGVRPTLIEWDASVPSLDVLVGEAAHADVIARGILAAMGSSQRPGAGHG
ncbi:DUF692 domain-containing protein [Luteibacter aegosomaticola]|uniref:MNIO family bufferin maturase n=1 Tax=Luteibacter aegosomaticola TaxID=2911538 RepID=UPI001FFA5D4B|nr:DUF692 domain-containing protein [Luteibacter aegosomaticola]UPG88204.1 DUF692 domain-containing protein [Luteibacter aegosomaticola]